MSYSKENNSSRNSTQTAAWKLVLGPSVFAKNYAQCLLENETFEGIFLYKVCNT